MNLQLFAERREPPTPRRRQEARRRGQVFHSVELATAAVLLSGYLAIRIFGMRLYLGIDQLFNYYLRYAPLTNVNEESAIVVVRHVVWSLLVSILPIMVIALVVGVAINVFQSGFVFTLYPVYPSLDRLNPVAGLARMFSRQSFVELAKAALKIGIVGAIAFYTVWENSRVLPELIAMDLNSSISVGLQLLNALFLRSGLALAGIGMFDYYYQRSEYEARLRMTREELKEELKQTEGAPEVRARIRQRQREIARRRMMAAVPKADVVITNPTHYAVALAYKMGEMPAPQVVAKGKGLVAQRIKEIAHAHGVVVVYNPALARALYDSVEVGQVIPMEFYKAVAEVLAFVWRLKGWAGGGVVEQSV